MPRGTSKNATGKPSRYKLPRAELLAFLGCVIGAILLRNKPLDFAMWLSVLMFGEMLQVRLPLGRATLSMSMCFEYAALCSLPMHEAMAVTALSTFLIESFHNNKLLKRAVFNSVVTVATVGVSASLFKLMAGSREVAALLPEFCVLPVFIVPAITYYIINRTAVAFIVSVDRRIAFSKAWACNFGYWFDPISCAAMLAFGIVIAAANEQVGAVAIACVLPILLLVREGYRHVIEPV